MATFQPGTLALACAVLICSHGAATAAELQQATVDGFNRYVAAYEAQSAAGPFLWIDGDSAAQRQGRETARAGGLVMERIRVRSGGREIDIPDGIVHHWLGTVFIPGANVDKALVARYAVADDMVDRGADRLGKPAIAKRCGHGAERDDELVA